MVCKDDEIYIEHCDNRACRKLVEKGCNYVAIKKDGYTWFKIACSKRKS